ncbi:leucine-rich repeat domain-containing protein [Actinomadura logoneensis]|uniref:Leucine-rich repeat domain-containing protein n=1 Tax=Actinomadura logoneensis TaxID=2293572 RepID=A0A372JS00_9ACTN|nr:leucine-rich repeat domain-containing protein [Actinomadura logoneensis]RFU42719.1 leucine-rich repeat domain-containing protein [Actinomadura logoneensis]
MSFQEPAKEFHGLPVVRFSPDRRPDAAAEEAAWLLEADFVGSPSLGEVIEAFLASVDGTRVTALLLGHIEYEGPDGADTLADVADRLPALRALSLGHEQDFCGMEATGDFTPVLQRLPRLERLDVRGRYDLDLRPVRHEALRTLRVESCNLPPEVMRAIADSDLPALERLDVWLGVDGGDIEAADESDLGAVLTGERLPSLRALALENSGVQDEIAERIATAPVVTRLRRLSLARGTFSDRGAEALLTGQPLTHLEHLDLHHHYLSDDMEERLLSALPTTEVDLGGGRGPWYGPFDEEVFNFVEDGRDF